VSMVSILVSASGEDRPGIVATVTRVLYQMGGNLEDSAMTRLGGAFAVLVIARIEADRVAALEEAFASVDGLSIQVKTLSEAESRPPSASGGSPYIISLYGADKPGIVYRVAALLEQLQVNITDVVTHCSSSDGRSPLYLLVFEVDLPAAADAAGFKESMASLARELQVEITVNRMETVEL